MLTSTANIHRHKLPSIGAIVIVKDRPLGPGRLYRRFIVESFPLSDSADQRFSRGIHTCTIRALDNDDRFRISGFYCEELE